MNKIIASCTMVLLVACHVYSRPQEPPLPPTAPPPPGAGPPAAGPPAPPPTPCPTSHPIVGIIDPAIIDAATCEIESAVIGDTSAVTSLPETVGNGEAVGSSDK